MPMNQQIMWRGIDELAISKHALNLAQDSSEGAKSNQEELLAKQAMGPAVEAYAKVEPLVPEARAEALKVRKFAFLAAAHRQHAEEVVSSLSLIKEEATEAARTALLGWIKADAKETAEKSATVDNRGARLQNAVAAAAEPYHIAVLRSQKYCEETYSKAKTAFSSMQKLITDAKALALQAGDMQRSYVPEAQPTQAVASGMMLQAEELRQWAYKLYDVANKACGSVASYQFSEQQAAANAAMTTIINKPMKLPPKGN